AATVQKQWIWHDGGSYFGVPFVNYLGWLLCVYTIFQLFAIYISRQSVSSAQEEQSDTTDRGYWYQAAAAYATTGLTWALPALTGGNAVITDATGQQWQAMQIYQSMALIASPQLGRFLIFGRGLYGDGEAIHHGHGGQQSRSQRRFGML